MDWRLWASASEFVGVASQDLRFPAGSGMCLPPQFDSRKFCEIRSRENGRVSYGRDLAESSVSDLVSAVTGTIRANGLRQM